MAASDYLDKNEELKSLYNKIYTPELKNTPVEDIQKFIQIIIKMCDEKIMDRAEAAYIITDILLKYDEKGTFEAVFDIASMLELSTVTISQQWSDEDIEKSWSELKETFNKIVI